MIFMAPERPIKDHNVTKDQLVQLKKDLQNMSLQDGSICFYIALSIYIYHKVYRGYKNIKTWMLRSESHMTINYNL